MSYGGTMWVILLSAISYSSILKKSDCESCFPPALTTLSYTFSLSTFILPCAPSASRLGETHMGELPAGMPAQVPNHGALTLLPSVSASPVCCRFSQQDNSDGQQSPATAATHPGYASEGQRDSLGDLWFATVLLHIRFWGWLIQT